MKKLPKQRIVLLGVGHTNAHVAKMWRMNAIGRTELVCISDRYVATYSGMLPGVLAGDYPPDAMQIDLVRFCQTVGARLIVSKVTGIDAEKQQVLFDDRPPLSYDALSIGIGSQPTTEALDYDGPKVLPIKPMQTLLQRLDESIELIKRIKSPKVYVVGGGLGGVEIAFCVPNYLRKAGIENPQVGIITSADELAPGVAKATNRQILKAMNQQGIQVITKNRVSVKTDEVLELSNGEDLPFDLAFWATGAVAPDLLKGISLSKDDHGFLLTRPTLQSVDDSRIFVVGDSGTLKENATRKAGVFAVRQGPVLWRNLQNLLKSEPLEEYRPQKNFLKLLNTGDGKAILEYWGFSVRSAWAWKLKDRIDGRFIEKFQDYRPMMMQGDSEDEPEMRCLGCGGKIGGSILTQALAELEIPQNEKVLIGLENPDDCAMVSTDGKPAVVTTDFFAAPLDDPFLVGRVAALNALSDAFVMGSQPTAALAIFMVPYGRAENQSEMLKTLLAGSLHEFKKSGTSLVGGHTIEGPQFTAGYTIVGQPLEDDKQFTKGELRPGDQLILTKPLGSGTMLAAHMQSACKADAFAELLETMLNSNQVAADLGRELGVNAMTDVTGFGLAGHLLEMLKASRLSAALSLKSIPLIFGARELFDAGIESTLAPANRDAAVYLDIAERLRESAQYQSLFDPQTCGGVLFGCDPEITPSVLQRLIDAGYPHAAVIGEVTESTTGAESRVSVK